MIALSNTQTWKTVSRINLMGRREADVRCFVTGWISESLGFGTDTTYPCYYTSEKLNEKTKKSRYDYVLVCNAPEETVCVLIEVKPTTSSLDTQTRKERVKAQLDKYANDKYAKYLIVTNLLDLDWYQQYPSEDFMRYMGSTTLEELQSGTRALDCIKAETLMGLAPNTPEEVEEKEQEQESPDEAREIALAMMTPSALSNPLADSLKRKMASRPLIQADRARRHGRSQLLQSWNVPSSSSDYSDQS